MKRESNTGISFFQRYLTVWVIVCMVLGILIGKYLPGIPAFLNRFEYARVSSSNKSSLTDRFPGTRPEQSCHCDKVQ